MPNNQSYQSDMNYVMLLTRSILSALGVWPSFAKGRFTRERIYKYVMITISYILVFCTLLPAIFFWIAEKRVRVRIRAFTMLLYGFMIVNQYYNLITRQNMIKRCLKHMEEDWKNVVDVEARKAMLESAKTGRWLATISATLLYSSGISFRLILPLSQGKIVTAQNITIRPLPYPSYLFSINIQATPIYEIMYSLHCFSGLIIISVGTGACNLVVVFAMHICGQLKILKNLVNDFGKEEEQKKLDVNKQLADIVEYQTRIRSFLHLVENAVQQICFIEITGITLIICILGYCILMEWENSNSIAMCSFFISFTTATGSMFIFSYAGEQVMLQAEKLAIASCEHEWYRLPNKQARSIVLVMIMSNKSTKLTAGMFIDLSFKAFGDIMKTAAAYLNVLRSVTE